MKSEFYVEKVKVPRWCVVINQTPGQELYQVCYSDKRAPVTYQGDAALDKIRWFLRTFVFDKFPCKRKAFKAIGRKV